MLTRKESTNQPVILVFGTLLLGLLLSLIAVVGVSAQRSSSEAIDALWSNSANQLLARVVLHVESIYEPGTRVVKYAESSVQSQRLDPTDLPQLFDHLEAVIDAFPTIVWSSYATQDGQYISVYRWPVDDGWEIRRTHRVREEQGSELGTWYTEERRSADGSWEKVRDEHAGLYDPTKLSWFARAKSGTQGESYWDEPRLFFSRKQLGMIHAMASYKPGTQDFRGVWAVEFEALPVVEYLGNIETTPGSKIYIVDRTGTIVSRPNGILIAEDSLVTADTAGDPLLLQTWKTIKSATAKPGEVFEVGDELAMFKPLSRSSTLPWYVIVTIPKDKLFAETRQQAQVALGVGVLGVLLALLLTFGAASRLNLIIKDRVDVALAEAKVGQYTLEAKLGSGGMGDVYRARHAMMRRPTAVKLLRNDLQSPVDVKRFEREVQTTCKLTHPNTITIFDYGRTPDGRFFYAMELIDGVTMLQLVDTEGPLPPGRAIFLADQICAALAEAHEHGLIHRDIKPSNILVSQLGGRGDFVKILDFGLVKQIETEGEELTQQGSFAGTPGFLAPEVPAAHGIESQVTDIYSLGAVLYVMISGTMPFEGTSSMGIFISQQTADPPLLSERMEQSVSSDLEALTMQCMDRDPAKRPQSMGALREALLACKDAGTWTEADANKWWAKNGDQIKAARDKKESTPQLTTLLATIRGKA